MTDLIFRFSIYDYLVFITDLIFMIDLICKTNSVFMIDLFNKKRPNNDQIYFYSRRMSTTQKIKQASE